VVLRIRIFGFGGCFEFATIHRAEAEWIGIGVAAYRTLSHRMKDITVSGPENAFSMPAAAPVRRIPGISKRSHF
jgi:hypothetical protein